MILRDQPVQVRQSATRYVHVGPPNIVLLLGGTVLLMVGLSFDWSQMLMLARFPTGELNNRWVLTDLAILRWVSVLVATLLIVSGILLWRFPQVVAGWGDKVETLIATSAQLPLFIPLSLITLVLMKTLFQLGLYILGYSAYGADDFSRSLNADYWLSYRRFDLGWVGWLGLGGSGWLPFPDYLFSLGLALYRDVYLTPKVVNLVISGIAVVVTYLLGRELFGRGVGLLTAALFAFQPWHVWLGISGMTSDLPSVTVIALFGMFLARWLRTDAPRSLLAASGLLAVANGFRYENWFFSIVLSVFVLFVAVVSWKRGHLTR